MVSSIQGLAPITNPLNSVLIEKKLINVDQKFIQLVSLAEGLPRTEVIESGRNYWRGVCGEMVSKKIMKPLNSFKKWLLNILVPYIEVTNKKKEDKK